MAVSSLESLLVKKLVNKCETKDGRFIQTLDSRAEVSLVRFSYTNVIVEHVDFPDKFLLWYTARPIQAVGHNFVVT